MTGMLASVCSVEEARQVCSAGVDIIDLKDPRKGALGALKIDIIEAIVEDINGRLPLSATIGDLPFKAGLLEPLIRKTALAGVDIIKVGVFSKIEGLAELNMLSELSEQGMRIVLVMFAEQHPQDCDFEGLSKAGITGVMLDTMDKTSGTLRDKLPISTLRRFVAESKKNGLLSGLAGSLRQADIADLLPLDADYLGFRGGLCVQGKRENVIDQEVIINVRSQIPRDYGRPGQSMAAIRELKEDRNYDPVAKKTDERSL